MSRIRTGLSPDAWRIEGPASVHAHGYLASQGRGGYAHIAGELVQGDPGATERQRESQRKHKARQRPICGQWMPQAKAYCARTPGHAPGCRTAEALEYNRRMAALREVPVLR